MGAHKYWPALRPFIPSARFGVRGLEICAVVPEMMMLRLNTPKTTLRSKWRFVELM
jgi:hypothetical protein